ncbi:MAG: hypothetical protein ACLTDV_02655 [Eubacterium sp.]
MVWSPTGGLENAFIMHCGSLYIRPITPGICSLVGRRSRLHLAADFFTTNRMLDRIVMVHTHWKER